MRKRIIESVDQSAAYPDGDFRMFRMVNLHCRTGAKAGTALHALVIVDHKRRFVVHHFRTYCCNRTAGDNLWHLAYIPKDLVIDAGRAGMFDNDGNIYLATAVNGAT